MLWPGNVYLYDPVMDLEFGVDGPMIFVVHSKLLMSAPPTPVGHNIRDTCTNQTLQRF